MPMKTVLILLSLSLILSANYFSDDTSNTTKQHKKVLETFRTTSSDGNSLLKKGDFEKYKLYKSNITALIQKIDALDLSPQEKKSLQKNMHQYSKIIDSVYKHMKNKTPMINKEYSKSLNGLVAFNDGINSTGYEPLLKEWHDLEKIKHRYIKKPSYQLSKKFDEKWDAVVFVLTDLCLDEEYEDPLLAYLDVYKKYFKDLNNVYKTVHYEKIKKVKPLSYAIKSQLEFAQTIEDN